jgi:hypothetical protein
MTDREKELLECLDKMQEIIKRYDEQPTKSNEELVFELIKYDVGFLEGICCYEDSIQSFEKVIKEYNLNDYLKHCIFLAIMKGAHELIEGDREFESMKENVCILFSQTREIYEFQSYQNYKYLPSFFYFSSTENAEKARDILSDFFGVNLLDWWYKL